MCDSCGICECTMSQLGKSKPPELCPSDMSAAVIWKSVSIAQLNAKILERSQEAKKA